MRKWFRKKGENWERERMDEEDKSLRGIKKLLCWGISNSTEKLKLLKQEKGNIKNLLCL
jgi:hypothetical protein